MKITANTNGSSKLKKYRVSIIVSLLITIVGALWSAQYFWIDREEIPVSRLSAWQLSILKVAHTLPWFASAETRLDRTIKLSNALLNQRGGGGFKDTLIRYGTALRLLEQHRQDHALPQHAAFKLALEQITLMHRGVHFLSQIGKQGDIEQAFQRFTQAYQALPSPTLTEQVDFLTEKMLHSLLLEHDIANAEKMRLASIELVANQPAGKLDEQYVNLYFGYGLCFLQNQTGAEYIDIARQSFAPYPNAMIWFVARNWDAGLISTIELKNAANTPCHRATHTNLMNLKP